MSLTTEQIENLIEENNQKLRTELLPMASDAKPRTGMINCVSELKEGDTYFMLHATGDVLSYIFDNSDIDLNWLSQGRTAWDKAALERQAKLNELNTRARAASAKAGVIDWRDNIQLKYFVQWDFEVDDWVIKMESEKKSQGVTYSLHTQALMKFMDSLTPDEQRLFAGGDA